MAKEKDEKRDPGLEYLDATPMSVPVKFRSNPGEVDRLKTIMKNLIQELQGSDQVESFEESLDFEVDDDDDILSSGVSPSELRYMREENLLTEKQEAERIVSQRVAAAQYRRKRDEHQVERERVRSGGERSDGGGEESRAERGAGRGVGEDARGGSGGAGGDSRAEAAAGSVRAGGKRGKAG